MDESMLADFASEHKITITVTKPRRNKWGRLTYAGRIYYRDRSMRFRDYCPASLDRSTFLPEILDFYRAYLAGDIDDRSAKRRIIRLFYGDRSVLHQLKRGGY